SARLREEMGIRRDPPRIVHVEEPPDGPQEQILRRARGGGRKMNGPAERRPASPVRVDVLELQPRLGEELCKADISNRSERLLPTAPVAGDRLAKTPQNDILGNGLEL